MTATGKAQIIKNAVDTLGAMLPLEWHDTQGRLINILQTGLGVLQGDICTPRTDGGVDPVWFKLTVDGVHLNGDGWYGYSNPPVMVQDGTYHDEADELTGSIMQIPNYKLDPLAAFFEFVEQAVK